MKSVNLTFRKSKLGNQRATIDRRGIDRGKKKKRKWRARWNDWRSVSVDLIYGSRVTSWLSILEYRSHRWTGRGLIYRQTALLRLVSSLIVSSEFVLERLHYRHSIDDKVSIKLGILFVQCDFISTRLTCSIIFYVFYGSRRESIDRSPSNFVNFLRKGIQKRLKKKKKLKNSET